MQRAYWEAFQAVLTRYGGPVLGNRRPLAEAWMSYPIGRSNFHLSAVMTPSKEQVRAALYMVGDNAKAYFALLRRQKDAVESELNIHSTGSRCQDVISGLSPISKTLISRRRRIGRASMSG
jgi:hypothetical protein